MPQIRPYEVQSSVAGAVDIPRARGEQLGVGQELANLGQGVMAVTDAVETIKTDKELNEQTKDLANTQLEFTNKIREGLNNRTLSYEDIKKQYDSYSLGISVPSFKSFSLIAGLVIASSKTCSGLMPVFA